MSISLKRAYEAPSRSDGCRILVERLWPRGLSKQDAEIDLWPKGAAPSTQLRRWFSHEPDKWPEFKRRYFKELGTRRESVELILERVRAGRVTFVFASREPQFNNAVALKEYLERTTLMENNTKAAPVRIFPPAVPLLTVVPGCLLYWARTIDLGFSLPDQAACRVSPRISSWYRSTSPLGDTIWDSTPGSASEFLMNRQVIEVPNPSAS